MQCALCRQDTGGGATGDVAGLSVCQACCTDSYLPTRLTDRGLHIGFWYRDAEGSVLSGMEELEAGGHHTLTALALYWADGARSLLEIADLVELESGKRDMELLLTYFRLLEKLGFINFEDSNLQR